MNTRRTQNPATEVFIQEHLLQTADDIEQAIHIADTHYKQHPKQDIPTRQQWLYALADSVEQAVERNAQRATEEMGKPIRQARNELTKCARVCRYYADNAESLLAHANVDGVGEIHLRPIGPILAIMPWNYPFWQVFRMLAPAILLGNPVLLKHAENVWGCAQLCVNMVRDAGLPPSTLQALYISVERVPPMIEDDRIRGVTLTGSERAGRSVAAQAGRAIKPVVLELGGSDPYIVLQDANVEAAIEAAVEARFKNNGESCIAAKRIIVEAPVYDTFVRRFASKVDALECDDPAFESTDVGPLARLDLLETVERQVRETIGYGARCLTGGQRRAGTGYFFEPTVLADVTETMIPFREEIFGPVASITVAQDTEDALRLANATPFGLGASLWCEPARARDIVRHIEAGTIAVNRAISSDPRVPFGGTKNSGLGRELGAEGLRAFANIQTVLFDS